MNRRPKEYKWKKYMYENKLSSILIDINDLSTVSVEAKYQELVYICLNTKNGRVMKMAFNAYDEFDKRDAHVEEVYNEIRKDFLMEKD